MTASISNPPFAEEAASLSADDFFARYRSLSPGGRRIALIARFRFDRESFLRYLWPEKYTRAFNRYHRAVLARPKVAWRDRKGTHTLRADAAPRGIAKSTLLKGDLCHDVLYAIEACVPVLSAETSLAEQTLADLMEMLRSERVTRLYGAVTITGGVQRFVVTTAAGHRCTFIAKSFGTSVRGTNANSIRPTKVVIDDGEDKLKVNNPDQRRKWWDFLVSDVLKLGEISGGLVVEWRGTVLHPDSVLARLLKADGWHAEKYRALEAWPERQDLWEACAKIWCDLTLGALDLRRQCARAFYERHKADMDRGARMLDEAALSLYAFYETIWREGLSSVLKEFQNEPRAGGTKFFRIETLARCRVEGTRQTGGRLVTAEGRKIPLEELRFFARLDPIPGKKLGTMGDEEGAGAGDFACIAIIGRDQFGYGFVVDLWLRRARDSEQLAALWVLCEKWLVEKASVESNGFQRLLGDAFRREQVQRREDGKYWQVAVDEDVSTNAKETRIASLEAPCDSGWIQFAEGLTNELFDQLDQFPDGTHDDGPDAVEGAWRTSGGVRVGMVNAPVGTPRPPAPRPHPRSP